LHFVEKLFIFEVFLPKRLSSLVYVEPQ